MTDSFDYVARMNEVLNDYGIREGERFLSDYIKAKDRITFSTSSITLTEWMDDDAIKMRKAIEDFRKSKKKK